MIIHSYNYIESISNNCWENYIQQMSTLGTWCDNIIIQAVANAHNCVIHITESDINKPDGTIITPVVHEGQTNTIFIGYINELHYVSTVPDKRNQNKNRLRYLKTKLKETNDDKQSRLAKRRKTRSRETDETLQKDGITFSSKENWTPIMEQKHVPKNLDMFHKSNEYVVHQCTVCREAWPLVSNGNTSTTSQYLCLRCSRDKKHPKKFSKENNMIPSAVPCELQGLTQVEEMLIARALPIMRVYVKPGGQRGYSGHSINLPQTIEELASSLPRYPKDLSVILVKMKGKDNNFKDVSVRRQNVTDALHWLINNNPHYSDVQVNPHSLNSLPENGVPHDLISVETENDGRDSLDPDLGP